MRMDNPRIEVTTSPSSSSQEVPISIPWTTSVKLYLTLRNSASAVMISTDLFSNRISAAPSIKWTLHDSVTGLEIKDPTFFPEGSFLRRRGDADTGKTLLQPDRPLEVWLSPFSSRHSESAASLDSDHTYHIRFEPSTILVHATKAKSSLQLIPLRNAGQPLFSPGSSPLPIHFSGGLSIRAVKTNSPWIEVRIIPSHHEIKSGSEEELSICLRVTLRDSKSPILFDSGSESLLFDRDTLLRQSGGSLEFFDTHNHVYIHRPLMFIQRVKTAWNLGRLIYETTELTPDIPIDIHHILLGAGTSAEKMEVEGFVVGGEYDVELLQCHRGGRWVRGGKMKNMFWRVISGDWKGESKWERDAIPIVQRDLLGTAAFKILRE